MATVVLTFEKGDSCAGGGHFQLQIKRGQNALGTVPITIDDLKDNPPENQEVIDALGVIMRQMTELSGADSRSDLRNLLDDATITLNFPSF